VPRRDAAVRPGRCSAGWTRTFRDEFRDKFYDKFYEWNYSRVYLSKDTTH